MKLADRLGMSVSEAKSSITSSEFIRWCVYLERDHNAFHREDYFFANIAYELYLQRCLWTESKPTLKMEDWLIKFESRKSQQEKIEKEVAKQFDIEEILAKEEARQKYIDDSKNIWLAYVMNAGKRPLPKAKE